MPYLKHADKERLENERENIDGYNPQTPGELNYCVTELVQRFLSNGVVNYERMNAAVGALEAAKLEFYRRVVAPYEDKKIQENGDVYDSALLSK